MSKQLVDTSAQRIDNRELKAAVQIETKVMPRTLPSLADGTYSCAHTRASEYMRL